LAGSKEFFEGAKANFGAAGLHVIMHIVKRYLLEWCLLEFLGEGGRKQIWDSCPRLPWLGLYVLSFALVSLLAKTWYNILHHISTFLSHSVPSYPPRNRIKEPRRSDTNPSSNGSRGSMPRNSCLGEEACCGLRNGIYLSPTYLTTGIMIVWVSRQFDCSTQSVATGI